MPCHIMKNAGFKTFCGKEVNGPDWTPGDAYVEELSRRVMEMPDCKECRIAYHEMKLERLRAGD